MTSQRSVVFAEPVRTAIGTFGGSLKDVPASTLGSVAIAAAVTRANIRADDVETVVMGNVVQAGTKMNPARQAAVHAGLPVTTPALTVNRVCGSGAQAIVSAAQEISLGNINVAVAGGMENMDQAPYLIARGRWGYRMGDGALYDSVLRDGLNDAFSDAHSGWHTEDLVEKYQVTRGAQDRWALRSQQQFAAAQADGHFKSQIVPVELPGKKGPTQFDKDEHNRPDTTIETLARLAIDLVYDLPNFHVEYVRVEPPGIPTAFWRSVGPSHNVFVTESFIDELAAAAKQDAVGFRRALLDKSPRARAVLDLAAEKADWGKPLPNGSGRGVSLQSAFGSYEAHVAEVEVSKNGAVRVRRVVCAVDCGTVVNPDTVQAQIQSGIIFGATAALYGEITLKEGRVEQTNFDTYQMLRINEAPAIEVHIVKSQEPPGGMGETGTSAVVPAIASAIFAATGKRLRKMPIEIALLKSG
jgi:Thiolase, N-terminal domain/Molybdopterin cofactor-binding domain